MTTKQKINEWLQKGNELKAEFVLVICDTFSYEDYPVFVTEIVDFYRTFEQYNDKNMQKVMEVYDLRIDLRMQIEQKRSWNFPDPMYLKIAELEAEVERRDRVLRSAITISLPHGSIFSPAAANNEYWIVATTLDQIKEHFKSPVEACEAYLRLVEKREEGRANM